MHLSREEVILIDKNTLFKQMKLFFKSTGAFLFEWVDSFEDNQFS